MTGQRSRSLRHDLAPRGASRGSPGRGPPGRASLLLTRAPACCTVDPMPPRASKPRQSQSLASSRAGSSGAARSCMATVRHGGSDQGRRRGGCCASAGARCTPSVPRAW
eukprot:scaffold96129_cov60-Phaeocystis_antarctica.AAC.2